jgi:hypothetical protein
MLLTGAVVMSLRSHVMIVVHARAGAPHTVSENTGAVVSAITVTEARGGLQRIPCSLFAEEQPQTEHDQAN